jgi:hypothetical protein
MEITRLRRTRDSVKAPEKNQIVEAYYRYKAAGFATLPTSLDKNPAIPKGESWLGGWHNLIEYQKSHGIGIICGKDSGNIECIDIDNHFGDAKNILDQFLSFESVSEIVDRYKIPLEKSVNGGFHLVYKCDLIEGNKELAYRMKGSKKEILIQTRGQGGYFCANPTPGYEIWTGDLTKIPVISSEERLLLLSSCRSFNEVVTIHKQPASYSGDDRPGDIYNETPDAIADAKQALTDAGWVQVTDYNWRRPGKERGVSATLGRAAAGIFYNFSSNADPFDSEKGYTPFQVVALLKYKGDFSSFAKELYERQKSLSPLATPTSQQAAQDKKERLVSQMELSRIDPLSDMTEPPVFCSIGNSPSMTAGNFSLLNGKAKSGKTFLLGSIVASMLNNSRQLSVLSGSLPDDKKGVLYFDTEQSSFHATRTIRRICSLIGDSSPTNLIAYSLRPFTPAERLSFIEEKITKTRNLGAVAIDGIRDLLTFGINDEAEATSLTSKFLKWTSEHEIHLILLLHQNKNDLNARGHIGTECLNKAETTISVSKDKSDIFIVSCEYSRDITFEDFAFTITDGQITTADLPGEEKAKNKKPQYIDDQKHFEVLDAIFKTELILSFFDLRDKIIYGFDNAFGESIARNFISHYLSKGWISRGNQGNKKFYRYERARF